MAELTRPVLRWHGGKWRLAPWIISHFPAHRIYVEPFGGGASVLLRKARAYGEVYNDLDSNLINLFRILRDPKEAECLARAIALTPYARDEFEAAYADADDPVDKARRFLVRSHMGFGSNSATLDSARGTGFRANSNRSGSTPAHDWMRLPPVIAATAERFRGVTIENRPAARVIDSTDSAQTLFYVDPPYLHETRSRENPHCAKHLYRHELDGADHVALLEQLDAVAGMVVLSGYPSPIYDDALPAWRRVSIKALADGAREREEVLWLNPQASAALERRGMPLFAEAAHG
ncbi:DNA adenine methylase [Mesorhizobium sp. CAU 1741]|uniref:DNA adenine methylase n=1 Tax=Mesorhizobium sp. CAU 1741 TaxID=3140366 RepID=UPI00325A58EB